VKKPFADRWWYARPQKASRPWAFGCRVFPQGGDEYCNPTIYIALPFLGSWVVRYKPGPLRTEACAVCQADQGPWCKNCESCHWGPRCHPCSCPEQYEHWGYCPSCRGYYCPVCTPNPGGEHSPPEGQHHG
jgi:hypothetical protein